MPTRKIVQIDEERCNGCGLCIPNCAEGALRILNGKAKLIRDLFCDGLGACLGHCPEDAITIVERDAEAFDEKAVQEQQHQNLENRTGPLPVFSGCPSSRAVQLKIPEPKVEVGSSRKQPSSLSHWPVQLKLVPVKAPSFQNADLLVAADCVPFAYPDFHRDFLKGRTVVVGCPKLDEIEYYAGKLTEIFKANSIHTITVLFMEVPCCLGLVRAVEEALRACGRKIPLKKVQIGIRGDIRHEENKPVFHHPRGTAHP